MVCLEFSEVFQVKVFFPNEFAFDLGNEFYIKRVM